MSHKKSKKPSKRNSTSLSSQKLASWATFLEIYRFCIAYVRINYRYLALLGFMLVVTYTAASTLIIQKSSTYIYAANSQKLVSIGRSAKVGIVFGGGVDNKEPRPLLQDRLDTAKQLLTNGTIKKVILSGDNRFLEYNEPLAMYTYLVDQGVDPERLQVDYAGRSTYETCERAQRIFHATDAILISEATHLARAIYLCRHFGIEAYGVISDGEASKGRQIYQRWREVLARNKAVFNVYFIGEQTVLGDPIDLGL